MVGVFDRGGIDLLVMPEQYTARIAHPQSRLFEDTQVCLVWPGHPTVAAALTFDKSMAPGHVAMRFGGERSVAFEEGFLPLRQAAPGAVQRAQLCHLPLPVIEAPFEMPPPLQVMVWPRYRAHDPAHAGLWQCLLDCAAGLDGGLHAGLAVGPGAVPDQPVLAP